MICGKCNREYPSRYYFKAPGICRQCFDSMGPEERAASQRPTGMQRMTTTAFTIDGHRIVETLGVVRGITVRSRSIFGSIGASLQTLVGGNITLFTELCEHTRSEAFDMMLRHAAAIGANAVVTRDVPSYAVVAGVPAQVLRMLKPVELDTDTETAGSCAS